MVLRKDDISKNEIIPGVIQQPCWDKPTGAENVSMGIITLEPGASLPEHYHIVEDAMIVISGKGLFIVDGEMTPISKGCALLAPAKTKHYLINEGEEPLEIVYTWPSVMVERFISGLPAENTA